MLQFLVYIIVILSIAYISECFKVSFGSTYLKKKESISLNHYQLNSHGFNRQNKVLQMSTTSIENETIQLFADKFINAWKKALCKGDSNPLYELISSPVISWDNPYVSNSNELKEGL